MEDKNYLNIEATAAQVKKAIEEVVEKLIDNPKDNAGKYFQLQYNEEEIDELNAVSIVLNKVDNIPPVDGKDGQMIVADGEEWIRKAELYSSLFSTSDTDDGNYTEVRFGPDLIKNPQINEAPISRLVLSGNPLSIEATGMSSSATKDQKVKANDAKTFKLVVAETANAIFKDSAKATFKNNSNFSVDSDGLHFAADNNNWEGTRFTLTSGAKMDVTGGAQVYIHDTAQINIDGGYTKTSSAQLIMHGACTVNMDDGRTSSGDYSYTGNSGGPEIIRNATLKIHDKACLSLIQGAYLYGSGQAAAYFEDQSLLKLSGSVKAYFEDQAEIHVDDSSKTYLLGSSRLQMQGNPCLCMNGSGQILFNSDDKSPLTYDPYLIANPTSLIFMGQSSSGATSYGPGSPSFSVPKHIKITDSIVFEDPTATSSYSLSDSSKQLLINTVNEIGTYGTVRTYVSGSVSGTKLDGGGYRYTVTNGIFASSSYSYMFGSMNDLCPINRNPRLQIADETMITIDASSGTGANYIKIGAGSGQLLQMHLTGNIFQQMSGNAHSEIHDNSKFIMRGTLGTKSPWEDGADYDTHCNDNWIRPIQATESPVFGMYDVSQFIMRGVWDTEVKIKKYTSYTFDSPTSTTIPANISAMTEEEYELFFDTLNQTYVSEGGNPRYNQIQDMYDEEDELLTSITGTKLADGGYKLTIKNFGYTSKYEDWKETINKIDGQPLLEVIENAEVRISGDSVLQMTDFTIKATSEGIAFGDGTEENTVTFSISELKELKKFLSGATITE